jgi:hypothetical protein
MLLILVSTAIQELDHKTSNLCVAHLIADLHTDKRKALPALHLNIIYKTSQEMDRGPYHRQSATIVRISFMRKQITLICGMTVAVCIATSGLAASTIIPTRIIALIETIAPGAQIVQPNEFDPSPCKPMNPSLNTIKADLAGNHRDDFAILVKTKTGKIITWNGRNLTEAQFSLIVFINDGHGDYEVKKLTSFTDYTPLSVNLQLVPAGQLHDIVSKQDVKTEHPAISLTFCEKSTTAYYLRGDRVDTISLVE